MTLTDPFHNAFTQDVIDRLLFGLSRAYLTALEHHVPEKGSTEQMFGFNLYGFAVHELTEEAKTSGGLLTLKSRTPTFRLVAAGYEIACHRVGHFASENIMTCFPKNEGAVQHMHEQLWLRGVDLGLRSARKLVLAHLGNDEDGFEAAYLCFPGSVEKQRISGWAHAHKLWAKESTGKLDEAAQGERAPDEPHREAEIRRRRKKKKKEENDGDE